MAKKKTKRSTPHTPRKNRTIKMSREDKTRLWWTGFVVVLMVVLLAEFAVYPHSEFPLAETRFFHAWFGFLSCFLIVVISKLLGTWLKRPERYYGEK